MTKTIVSSLAKSLTSSTSALSYRPQQQFIKRRVLLRIALLVIVRFISKRPFGTRVSPQLKGATSAAKLHKSPATARDFEASDGSEATIARIAKEVDAKNKPIEEEAHAEPFIQLARGT